MRSCARCVWPLFLHKACVNLFVCCVGVVFLRLFHFFVVFKYDALCAFVAQQLLSQVVCVKCACVFCVCFHCSVTSQYVV